MCFLSLRPITITIRPSDSQGTQYDGQPITITIRPLMVKVHCKGKGEAFAPIRHHLLNGYTTQWEAAHIAQKALHDLSHHARLKYKDRDDDEFASLNLVQIDEIMSENHVGISATYWNVEEALILFDLQNFLTIYT